MTGRKHKVWAFLLALAMVLGASAPALVPAHAAEQKCRVRVQSGTEEAVEPLLEAGAVADLYLIAKMASEGVYEGGLDLPMDQSKWREMAQAQAAGISGRTPDISGLALGQWADANSDGTEIVPGIYLLVVRPPEGNDYLKEFQDDEGNAYLASEIISKEHAIQVAPEIIALPGKAPNENGTANTGDPGPWVYDLDVSVKPELEKRLGAIEIVKDLLTYETAHDAFFVFQVEGYLGDEHVYSNLVSMRFDGYGEQRVRLENIPVGTEVTVTEAYSTPGYALTGTVPSDGKVTVDATEVLEVRFENDYTGTRDKGGGIMNNFDYDLERGEWSWTQG